MPVSELRLIKRCAEFCKKKDIKNIPAYTRGIYALFKYRPRLDKYDVGVIEEKNSRVIEVLLSALSPFQLMAGKILGLGGNDAFYLSLRYDQPVEFFES